MGIYGHHARNLVADYYSKNPFYLGKTLLPQRCQRVKILPQGELLVINPKGILFISQIDLVKHLQMSVNSSNLKKFPIFTPKVDPRVFCVVLIILQFQ